MSSLTNNLYIVEDDSFFLKLYQALFSGTDIVINSADNEIEIDWFLLLQSDLIILDLLMAGKDGIDILEYISTVGFDSDIIIISDVLLCNLPEISEKILKCNLNIRGILRKPFAIKKLKNYFQKKNLHHPLLAFNRNNYDLLLQAIINNNIVYFSKIYQSSDNNENKSRWIYPGVLLNGHVFEETDYIDLVTHTKLLGTYYQTLLSTIFNDQIENLNQTLPITLCIHPSYIEKAEHFQILQSQLTEYLSKGIKICIAIKDPEYFQSSRLISSNLSQLRDLGIKLALDDADFSIRNATDSSLHFFDEIKLSKNLLDLLNCGDIETPAYVKTLISECNRGIKITLPDFTGSYSGKAERLHSWLKLMTVSPST